MWLWWAPLFDPRAVRKVLKQSELWCKRSVFNRYYIWLKPVLQECSRQASSGYLKRCVRLPSLRLVILLSSQLMKCVGQQEHNHASAQSGGATTEAGGNVKHGVARITQAIWCERLKTCCLLCVSQRHWEKRHGPNRLRCEGLRFRPSLAARSHFHCVLFWSGSWSSEKLEMNGWVNVVNVQLWGKSFSLFKLV